MEKKHGTNQLKLEGRVIVCRPEGAFNFEGVLDYESTFVEMVGSIQEESWGIFTDCSNCETGGPDVLKRVLKEYQWSIANGCRYSAYYITSKLHEFFIEQVMKELSSIEYKTFTEEQAARDWLHQKLNQSQ